MSGEFGLTSTSEFAEKGRGKEAQTTLVQGRDFKTVNLKGDSKLLKMPVLKKKHKFFLQ